jgi:hypothetical protein
MAGTDDEASRLFARIEAFGWDETKRQSNLLKHEIDLRTPRRSSTGRRPSADRTGMAKSGTRS